MIASLLSYSIVSYLILSHRLCSTSHSGIYANIQHNIISIICRMFCLNPTVRCKAAEIYYIPAVQKFGTSYIRRKIILSEIG